MGKKNRRGTSVAIGMVSKAGKTYIVTDDSNSNASAVAVKAGTKPSAKKSCRIAIV